LWTGTIAGHKVTFGTTLTVPTATLTGGTGGGTVVMTYTGTLLTPNSMSGTFSWVTNVSVSGYGQQATFTSDESGDWAATRTAP
jgi:hypothetical protein